MDRYFMFHLPQCGPVRPFLQTKCTWTWSLAALFHQLSISSCAFPQFWLNIIYNPVWNTKYQSSCDPSTEVFFFRQPAALGGVEYWEQYQAAVCSGQPWPTKALETWLVLKDSGLGSGCLLRSVNDTFHSAQCNEATDWDPHCCVTILEYKWSDID